jgi:DNA-binding response OmpR family regulator
METVLIIEDDPTMLLGLKDNFEFKGYSVMTAIDGQAGFDAAINEEPDLILLDIMLPKINGYEICRLIREKELDMPIIMLTAKGQESDIILGLDLGADDYITKPFSINELLARARVLMRRIKDKPSIYQFGDCRLDIARRCLKRSDQEIELTDKEFKMLRMFVTRHGCVLTRKEILNTVWGFSHFITLKDVDSLVTSVRKKIEPDLNNITFIHTIEKIGYKFTQPELNGNDFNN